MTPTQRGRAKWKARHGTAPADQNEADQMATTATGRGRLRYWQQRGNTPAAQARTRWHNSTELQAERNPQTLDYTRGD